MTPTLALLLLLTTAEPDGGTPASTGAPFATGCTPKRDKRGRIQRSEAAKDAFKVQHPCPATGATSGACPGWVIDHIWPLCAGGCDVPVNMQWQRRADSTAKDRLEWRMCRERADEA
jgi:hypothetical protein